MITFHFCWDLRHFGYLEYSLKAPFWVGFRAVIVFLFLSAIGWSSYIAVASGQSFARFRQHMAFLLLSALSISLATYIVFPTQWVFFGILHFIFVASIIVRPLASRPFLSFTLGALIYIVYWQTDWLVFTEFKHFLYSDLGLPRRTVDIIAPIPWISAVLVGPMFGYLNVHSLTLPLNWLTSTLAFLGKYALRVYLTHQIILFSLVASLHYLIIKLS